MCSRSGTWLSDTRREVTTSSQTPTTTAIDSPHSHHQVVDANHNSDSSPGNKVAAAASSDGDMVLTPSASPAVSELIDKGVVYLRDRIFNRDSGRKYFVFCSIIYG